VARADRGSGRIASARELEARRARLGLDIPGPIDLNEASYEQLAAHSAIGRSLARRIERARAGQTILTPVDLYQSGAVTGTQLAALERITFGRRAVRPMITHLASEPDPAYAGEPLGVRIDFLPDSLIAPEILSLHVRFPSGIVRRADFRVPEEEWRSGSIVLAPFVSAEAGELHVVATMRDAEGDVHQYAATFGVFTRNPVRFYVSPTYLTKSGSVGAPRYDFGQDRWYCEASVRWVNSTGATVTLDRNVSVDMTDAGVGSVGSFTFNLSADIAIPAMSTVYGNWRTWHDAGSAAYQVFIDKGDLTFHYVMGGSGFEPTRTQIWRAMRVIGYNIVRVGDFTNAERNEYREAARDVASGIFRSRDMTVHGVELYRIEGTREMDLDKARFRFISDQAEINALRDKYTVPNWFLDVFFVEGRWDGAFGSSPTDGPVDKDGDDSGLVIRRDSDTINLGQTFAHEAGHYLGLEHADEDDGCADTDPSAPDIADNFIFSSSLKDSDVITGCQINTMRQHGLVHALTP
jgi:hypothetical protein